MKTKKRTLGVIAATVAAAGLVAGLAFASGGAAATVGTPTTATTPTTPMSQMMSTGSMMTGGAMDMGSMMGTGDMATMHQMMRTMMRANVSDTVLAECDTAHTAMMTGTAGTSATGSVDHAAHHMGSGS